MISLDVSELPAPEPLEKVLELISKTSKSEIICMIHRQHPCALLPLLTERGYSMKTVNSKNNLTYIYIWYSTNLDAENIIDKEITNVQ
jgi:hypothetical protein